MIDLTTQILEYSITIEKRLKELAKQRAISVRNTEIIDEEIEKIKIIKSQIHNVEPEMIFI